MCAVSNSTQERGLPVMGVSLLDGMHKLIWGECSDGEGTNIAVHVGGEFCEVVHISTCAACHKHVVELVYVVSQPFVGVQGSLNIVPLAFDHVYI